MKPYISKMEEAGLIPKTGKVLDLGCGTGDDAAYFSKKGLSVTAVDRDVSKVSSFQDLSIEIVKSDIRDFIISPDTYNVIVCVNVLPFIANKADVLKILSDAISGLVSGGVIFFTVFGPKDEWFNKPNISFFSYEEISSIVDQLQVNIYEKSTMEGFGKTMKGDIKYWNIHRFLCIKK